MRDILIKNSKKDKGYLWWLKKLILYEKIKFLSMCILNIGIY